MPEKNHSIKGPTSPDEVHNPDTDPWAAQTQVQRGEQRFRAAVEAAQSLIWTNSAEGRMEGEQPGWANFTGQSREEYYGYGWAKAVHPEDSLATIDAWNQAVASKGLFEFEHRILRKDGVWRLCTIRGQPIFDELGNILEWVGVHTDITESRESELALRVSEQRAHAFITASSDVVYRMNADWTEMAPLRGMGLVPDASEPSRTWLADNLFAEDHARVLAAIQEAIHTKSVFALEHRVRRVDGTVGWTVSKAVPILDSGGEIIEWFGTACDVTERRRAEEALRDSEARKVAILDSAIDAIVTMDHRGRLVEFNRAAERTFGHAREQVIGRLLADVIIPSRFRERHQQDLAHYLATGEGPVIRKLIELPALRADGTEFPAEIAIIPIPGIEPPLFTAFLRDVTEQRALQASLVARAEQAALADPEKDEFLSMLAHELRNPLGPLRNAAELLGDEGVTADDRVHAKSIIDRQVGQMSRMIDDLLDVSRITEGKIELRRELVALQAILSQSVKSVSATCGTHQQTLDVSLPESPVYLNADATRLEQVFSNLLENASKYGGDGCHIFLTAEEVLNDSAPEVKITVRDDGRGIDAELLPRGCLIT